MRLIYFEKPKEFEERSVRHRGRSRDTVSLGSYLDFMHVLTQGGRYA